MRDVCRLDRVISVLILFAFVASANGVEADSPSRGIALDDASLSAISDGAESIGPEEMPAYWSLVRLVQDQPFEKLPTQPATFDQLRPLCDEPNRYRGEGKELELTVCRVLAYSLPANDAGVERLYEVWGRDERNPGELIIAVATELPPEFPTGEQVNIQATFRGYFFKLQGYRVASQQREDSFRTAPLFVGRLAARPHTPPPFVTQADCWTLGAGGVLIASLTLTCCFSWRRTNSAKQSFSSVTQPTSVWEEWLSSSQTCQTP